MKLKYDIDTTDHSIVTDQKEIKEFFSGGHPTFLIPDFLEDGAGDVWITYLDFLDRQHDNEIFDQEGGEVACPNSFAATMMMART